MTTSKQYSTQLKLAVINLVRVQNDTYAIAAMV
jgi:hypothetical protein